MSVEEDVAKSAGRGVLLTMGAKVVFIATGFGMQLVLPRVLGPLEYGRYATVATIVSIVTNTLVTSMVQAVSKRTSEDESHAEETKRAAWSFASMVALVLGGGLLLMAPVLAERWQRDVSLTPLFLAAAPVVAAYALYAALIGSVNGLRRFHQQAGFDMAFSVLRTSAIVVGAFTFGALGALAGFASAAVLILIASLAILGRGVRGRRAPSLRTWTSRIAPIAIYQVCLNGILQIDQPMLRAAIASASTPENASEVAGFYRAAQTFAFVPYQLVLAVTFVVFPAISRATAAGDRESAKLAIRSATRFSSIVLLALAAPIGGAASGVMRIAFSESYVRGAPALEVLSLGMVPFALFAIFAAILVGAGMSGATARIALLGLVLVAIGNAVAVRAAAPSAEAIVAAAWATSGGAAITCAISAYAISRDFDSPFELGSIPKVGVSAVLAFVVARMVPHATAMGALLACAAGFATFFSGLVLTRELGSADLALTRKVLGRSRR